MRAIPRDDPLLGIESDAFGLSTAARQPQPTAAADERLAVPNEAQQPLCRALLRAIEEALDLEERLPSSHRSAPPAFTVQHAGKPLFNPDLLRQQMQQGWHRLVAIDLRPAVLAPEALRCVPEDRAYQDVLAEPCAQVGQ